MNQFLVGGAGFAMGAMVLLVGRLGLSAEPDPDADLPREIFKTMLQVHGTRPGFRPVHAKGIVCQGTFTASAEAAGLSKAAHFQGAAVPVTVRFSDGAPDPAIPDNSPSAGPRGMAIRFNLPGGEVTDVVAMSHNGFVVGTGREFLALQKAIVATDPAKPHPWPIEEFLGSHPRALKFVQDNSVAPASFSTEPFFANDAFIFVNKAGVKQAARYQIVPVAPVKLLSEAEAKDKAADYLTDDLKTRLAAQPVRFHLMAQIPNEGDATNDPSLVWPEDRKKLDLGMISLSAVVADSPAAEKALAFDPTNLTDGIEPSDDPIPELRSRVYALSAKHRHAE